ncbi:MAG: hypothetical protein KW788_00705 [Candidatus Doudnabacteria bacterium]|nr:hypothetical protein [Candidatus Doudnabacteria bacterium]
MSRNRKIAITVIVLIILLAAAVYFLKIAKAPTDEEVADQTPAPTPTPSPAPVPAATEGTLVVHADVAKLHITKIVLFRNGESTEAALDSEGNLTMSLYPGNYEIDYKASPDLYPHSPERVTIVAGQTHEVDFIVQN